MSLPLLDIVMAALTGGKDAAIPGAYEHRTTQSAPLTTLLTYRANSLRDFLSD